MRKITLILNNKEYERNGISAGDYEDFADIKEKVNQNDDYKREDIANVREALSIAFGRQFSAEELKKMDTSELLYQFMLVDVALMQGLNEKVEKMRADFGIGE